MTFALALLQTQSEAKSDMTLNYVVLGVLILIVVVLALVVINRRKKED